MAGLIVPGHDGWLLCNGSCLLLECFVTVALSNDVDAILATIRFLGPLFLHLLVKDFPEPAAGLWVLHLQLVD